MEPASWALLATAVVGGVSANVQANRMKSVKPEPKRLQEAEAEQKVVKDSFEANAERQRQLAKVVRSNSIDNGQFSLLNPARFTQATPQQQNTKLGQ